MKNIKICSPSIFVLLLGFVFLFSIFVKETHAYEDYQRVHDEGGLLSESDIEELEYLADEFSKNFEMDMILVTTTNTDGKTSRDFADDYYDYGGYGMDEQKSGVLLLIDMDNREIYVSTTGFMIKVLTDSRIESVLDEMYYYIQDARYFGVFSAGIAEVEKYVQSGFDEERYVIDEATGQIYSQKPPLKATHFLGALVIGAVVSIVTTLIIKAGYKKEFKPVAYDFRTNGDLHLTKERDILTNKFVTTRRIPKNDDNSGGGSSTHTSSSGTSHGGGGRSF